MADVEEVAGALKAAIAALIYPDGTTQPSANGFPTQVMQGWPQGNRLNDWLPPGKSAGAAGGVLISVYQQPNMSTRTTRFQEDWEVVQPAAVPVSASLAAGVVTFVGAASAPVNIAFAFGLRSTILSLTGQEGYGPTAIASAAAAFLTVQGRPATADGATLTCAGLTGVRVEGVGALIREVERVRQGFQVTIWAPSPAARVATAKAFMAGLFAQTTLALPDGTRGNLFFVRDNTSDEGQAQILYRRDVFCTVEFGITETVPGFGVGAIRTTVTPASGLPT